jgi:hypothetical protein
MELKRLGTLTSWDSTQHIPTAFNLWSTMVINFTQVVTLAKDVLKPHQPVLLVLLVRIVPRAMFILSQLTTHTLGTASPFLVATSSLKFHGHVKQTHSTQVDLFPFLELLIPLDLTSLVTA